MSKETQTKLKVHITEEQPEWTARTYTTDFHKLKIRSTVLEKFLSSLNASTRKGYKKYNDEQKHARCCLKVQQLAKPLVPKMSGEEWETSIRSLLYKVFNEKWDRDPEKEGVIGTVSGSGGTQPIGVA